MSLSTKQRVKVNAALSMIHAQGYDPQAVVNRAKHYEKQGSDKRGSYERAINDFAEAQPAIGGMLAKITRLVQASDDATVGKYDQALSTYIVTGDSSAIDALAPTITQDALVLAHRLGEIDPTVTAETVEAALGFAMPDEVVQHAASVAAEPAQAPAVEKHSVAFTVGQNPAVNDATASQVGGFGPTGYVPSRAKWDAATVQGAQSARGLLAAARRGGPDVGIGDRPQADTPMSRAQIKANIVGAGVIASATI